MSDLNMKENITIEYLIKVIEKVFLSNDISKETFVQALVAVLLKTDSDNIVEQTLRGEN